MAQPEATGSLSNARVISYAFGDVANNLAFMMTSLFFMAYMTDIVGIAPAMAGTIYGVTKVWAGVTDLTAGNTVDKANTRWGRLRPWILFGSLPLAIALVMLFSTPAGLTPTQAIVWILLFDALFQLCYSFVNIPYGSLASAMTQDPVDRSRLSGARSIASSLTGVILAIVLSPQFANTKAEGIRQQFTITTIILAVIAIALYVVCFLNTREVVPKGPGKSKFSTTMKMVGQNKPLLTLCIGAFFLLGAMFTMSAVAMYYAKFVLLNASAFIYLQIAQTVGTVLVASFVPTITVKVGKRLGYVVMAAVAVLGYAIVALVPVIAGNNGGLTATAVAVVAWFVYGAGSGGTNALMFSMQADTVDFGEWKTGIRAEGGSYSILSFVRKCGQGLGGIIGGAVVGAFGYADLAATARAAGGDFTKWTPDQLDLLHRAQPGIAIAAGLVLAILGVVAAIIIFFYPLDANQHRSLVADLNDRRAKRAAGVEDVDAAGALKATRPVVTVSEQYGAGGRKVGELVAARLGVPFTGQRFSSEELEALDEKREVQDSPTNRFLVSIRHGWSVDADAGIAADAEADHQIVLENTGDVLDAIKDGGVILGRDAVKVLDTMQGVLNVRLQAPLLDRVSRAAEESGVDKLLAADRQDRETRMRSAMSLRLMGYDQDDPKNYDLVLDTSASSLDDVADQIVAAYREKFPAIV